MEQLIGIHHVSAITSDAKKIYDFFTYVLGLRLVKKTVNQDDVSAYHLFFADDKGSPGTDMTFFEFNMIPKHIDGANEIERTSFRVPNDEAIRYWKKRLKKYKVKHEEIIEMFGRKTIFFEDFDAQKYALISDETDDGVQPGTPWKKGPVPNEFGITGLGPIFLKISDVALIDEILQEQLFMTKKDKIGIYHLYEMGEGGNGASIFVKHEPGIPYGRQGYGSIHHVAFRVKDEEALYQWIDHLNDIGVRHSGFVDRFYFKSLYSRLYPNILFEFATEGPGFIDDEEDYETLGEILSLPPKLRDQRDYIEKKIDMFDTTRSTKTIEKEYLD